MRKIFSCSISLALTILLAGSIHTTPVFAASEHDKTTMKCGEGKCGGEKKSQEESKKEATEEKKADEHKASGDVKCGQGKCSASKK